MISKELITFLEADLKKITDRIDYLEFKEKNGTITTSSTNPEKGRLDELNELYILKDHYDIELYRTIIKKIKNGRFQSMGELSEYLESALFSDDNDGFSESEADEVVIKTLSKNEFLNITTLDRIMSCVEKFLGDQSWPGS